MKRKERKRRIRFAWLIGASGLVMLLAFHRTIMAQSSPSHEPLPRTFEGVRQLMAPPVPVELQGIRLLMTPDDVKAILKKAGFRFKEQEGTVRGIHGSAVYVSQPHKGFQRFDFQFREGELYSMLVEYDMNEFSLDFQVYLTQLKAKYGEPVEVKDIMKDAPAPLHTFDSFIHRWVDEQTELGITHTPPGGKDPLNRSMPGDVVWNISDKRLAEKTREENAARRFKPEKDLTEEERQEALKQLLEDVRKNQEQIQKHKKGIHLLPLFE